jgi:5-methylcytosine-specific restriction enzyme subunit McrC
MGRPVLCLAEWTRAELAYGPPAAADVALASQLGRDGDNRLDLDWLHDGTLRVSSRAWVGVVRLERVELHVVPKLSGGNLGVLQMVDYASGLDALKRIPGIRDLDAGGAGMLDLVCLMLVEATEAVLRQGLLRDYTLHEEPIGTLRGRLRLEEQVRRHYGQVDVLECRFDEHEGDVLENQLLLAALAVARRVTGAEHVRARATRLAIAFGEVCQPATLEAPEARRQLVYHRRNGHYRVAHYWALLLLERLRINDLYATGAGRSFVFLLNMNQIFERFVTRLLRDVLEPRGVRVIPQQHTASIIVDEDGGETYSRVVPDLLLGQPAGGRVPVDAKYKRYDDHRVDPSDVYQGFLYAFAYADPPRAWILYPGTSGSAGFRLAVQSTSGVRGARITGKPIDVGQVLQRRVDGFRGEDLWPDAGDLLTSQARASR